jgi:hypothetical protein
MHLKNLPFGVEKRSTNRVAWLKSTSMPLVKAVLTMPFDFGFQGPQDTAGRLGL